MKKFTDRKVLKWIFGVSGTSLWWTLSYLVVRLAVWLHCGCDALPAGDLRADAPWRLLPVQRRLYRSADLLDPGSRVGKVQQDQG